MAEVSLTGTSAFTSTVPVGLTGMLESGSEYTLLLAGVSPPTASGLVSYSIPSLPYLDQWTTDVSYTQPVTGSFTYPGTIGSTPVDLPTTLTLEAQASVTPEPSTLTLLGIGAVTAIGYALCRRQKLLRHPASS
jgi:hypothetical protein